MNQTETTQNRNRPWTAQNPIQIRFNSYELESLNRRFRPEIETDPVRGQVYMKPGLRKTCIVCLLCCVKRYVGSSRLALDWHLSSYAISPAIC